MTINFNVSPYYDDFDEDKNFYRVLFKPGVAVQTRELTQLQTILQNQIDRFGRHVFKNGAMVIPGQSSVDTSAKYVKIESSISNLNSLEDLTNTFIYGNTSGVVAKVIAVADADNTDPRTLIVKYFNSDETTGTTATFSLGESLRFNNARSTAFGTVQSTAGYVGDASVAQIEEGIYFVNGFFIKVPQQTIILEKYNNTPTYRIGLVIDEQLITAVDDGSLVDNAQGTYNYAAPGADRYKVEATLSKLPLDSTLDQDFIELIRIESGVLKKQVLRTEYSVLEKTLARRTYDESGDYTVRPFQIQVREYRNNDRGPWTSGNAYVIGDVIEYAGNTYISLQDHSVVTTPNVATSYWLLDNSPYYNRGVYTVTGSASESAKSANLAIGLDPGKAYIRGYEIEKIATEFLTIPKARDTAAVGDDLISTQLGNYILVSNVCNYFDTTSFANVDLRDQLTATRGTAAGSQVGTARVRYIEYNSGIVGNNAAVYKLSLFDVNMFSGKTFERDVKQISAPATSATADVVSTAIMPLRGAITISGTTLTGTGTAFLTQLKVGDYIVSTSNTTVPVRVTAISSDLAGTVTAGVTITGTSYGVLLAPIQEVSADTLVFKLPQTAIKSTADLTARVLQRYDVTPSGTGTIGPGTPTGGTTAASFESTNTSDYIAINKTNGNVVALTQVVLSGDSNSATLYGFTDSVSHAVFAKVVKTTGKGTLARKTKTLTSATKTVTAANAAATIIPLANADVLRITSILCNGVDIKDQYTLDNGQRPTHYSLGKVIRKSDYGPPSSDITINYLCFEHTGTGDYFSADSYSGIRYEDIPTFTQNGVKFRLSDALDFRPKIDTTGGNFTGTGSSLTAMPVRDRLTQLDYDYYLPRKDKIAIDSEGKFFSIQGVSALQPKEPNDPDNAMVLYKLTLGPYTLGVEDVDVKYIDNKRYTMRDIGRLEKRIENIEYYTALSLLEQETKAFTILDADGLDRYKAGFVVDNFEGHGVGDVNQPDYLCSIDMESNTLRPFFRMDNFNLNYYSKTNTKITGDLITLPFSNVTLIDQPYASTTENVNPYNVFKFIGDLKIHPEVDEWFETDRRPDLVVNQEGNFDSVVRSLESQGVLGTVWNSWQTQWTGVPTSTSVTRREFGQWGPGNFRDITTTQFAQQIGQARQGVRTTAVARIDTRVSDARIISTAAIPFIRQRFVAFVAKGLKPYTRYYPYFEGVDVSAFVIPATKITFTANVGNNFDCITNAEANAEEVARRSRPVTTLAYKTPPTDPNGQAIFKVDSPEVALNRGDKLVYGSNTAIIIHKDYNSVYVVNQIGTFTAGTIVQNQGGTASGTISSISTSGTWGNVLISSALGDVAGIFEIPNRADIRFRTGIKEFKLINNTTNNEGNDASYAKARYTASGTLQTTQATVTSVRNADIVKEVVSENKVITNTWQTTTATDWVDPLAQTFLIQQDGGAFLTKVELFFQQKDNTLPVRIEIRDVVNGYPGKSVLPFSSVSKQAFEVVTSTDASVATTFEFPSPVFVENNTEYALVILSDSNEYYVWIAQMGQKTITGDRVISSQPYLGTLFKSQNASTWTAEQNQDLKFKIYRATFSPLSGTMTFVNDRIPATKLQVNPLLATNTTPIVKVYHPNHWVRTGTNVTLSGVTGTVSSNIQLSDVNKKHKISNVFVDYYTIDVSNVANVTGLIGGANVFATTNIGFDAIQPVAQTLVFQGTNLDFYVRATDYASGALAAAPGISVIPNNTNYFTTPKVVLSKDNDDDTGLNKSFQMTAYFVSTKENLSPVIDMNRLSVITVKNKLNNPTKNNYNIGGVIDTRTIVNGNIKIGFANVAMTNNVTANVGLLYSNSAAVQSILKTINPGREIIISGAANTRNNVSVIVSSVDSVGNITVRDYVFSGETPGANVIITTKEGYVDEIAPSGGSVISKYMTKPITLATPATMLKIIYAGSIPPNATVDVYYKTLPAGSYASIKDIEFYKAEPTKAIVKTLDATNFTDIEYDVTNLPTFTSMVVKLVFKADTANSSIVPLVRDLRIIACD